jgi:hypothetical protein
MLHSRESTNNSRKEAASSSDSSTSNAHHKTAQTVDRLLLADKESYLHTHEPVEPAVLPKHVN